MGLQIGPRLDYKSGQLLRLQIGAKRLQIGAGITNRGKKITNQGRDYKLGQRDYKSGQLLGLQLNQGWITNQGSF